MFINIGVVIGLILLFVFINVIGLENIVKVGEVVLFVVWVFYLGVIVLLGLVLWIVFCIKEYVLEDYVCYKGFEEEDI